MEKDGEGWKRGVGVVFFGGWINSFVRLGIGLVMSVVLCEGGGRGGFLGFLDWELFITCSFWVPVFIFHTWSVCDSMFVVRKG